MLEWADIQTIVSHFGLDVQSITKFHDTSRGEDDKRWNYILDDAYVLKVNSVKSMWESRLHEIQRLTARYRGIGIYCPKIIPTLDGKLSYSLKIDGKEYICFVEEYAIYPVMGWGMAHERKEVIEHLGILASKYTGVDLLDVKSMWSIIDLAPLDDEVDEKQENTNELIDALRYNGYTDLAKRVDDFNLMLREKILAVFKKLPRCVYQGDLNSTNQLHDNGHFVGLIDFNMSGTDVNINVFLNETNWFPETVEFDVMSVAEILDNIDVKQNDLMSVILQHYTLNNCEKYALPYYKRLITLFQYPNVCLMVEWLNNEARREKCAKLIEALVDVAL